MKYSLTTTGIKKIRLSPEKLFRRLLPFADARELQPNGLAYFNRIIDSDTVLFRNPSVGRESLIHTYSPKEIFRSGFTDFNDFDHLNRCAREQGIILLMCQTEITTDEQIGMSVMFAPLDERLITPLLRKVFIDQALKTL